MCYRPAASVLFAAACSIAAAASSIASPGSAAAGDYSFHVSYRAYLSGFTIGEGVLAGEFDGSEYSLSGVGGTSGFAKLFSSYHGTSEAKGSLNGGTSRFHAATQGDGEHESVTMQFRDGRVRDVEIAPPRPAHRTNHPARVQIRKAHKRDVVDPLSAFVMTGGHDGSQFNREVCDRVVPVFSGETRFDIALSFREIRTVSSSGDSYSGPVMVCGASYRPVAGHRTDQSTVEYLRDKAKFEFMLAPMPNSDMLVPYRITVSTPLGPAVLQALSFKGTGRFAAFAGGDERRRD